MLDRLPHEIDPIAFADKQRTLQGLIPLNKLERDPRIILFGNFFLYVCNTGTLH